MKLINIFSVVLMLIYSCKKETTDYNKIAGEWIWKKTTYRFSSTSWGIIEPNPAFADSTFMSFDPNKTFVIKSDVVPFIRPVPRSGVYEITSPSANSKRVLIITGPDLQESLEINMNANNLILIQRTDSSIHQSDFIKK